MKGCGDNLFGNKIKCIVLMNEWLKSDQKWH